MTEMLYCPIIVFRDGEPIATVEGTVTNGVWTPNPGQVTRWTKPGTYSLRSSWTTDEPIEDQ